MKLSLGGDPQTPIAEVEAALRAKLDEDEQTARAAQNESGRWRWEHGIGEMCGDKDCPYGALLDEAATAGSHIGTVVMEVHGYDVKAPWQGAVHIARHDPARVLAEVKAKRDLLDELDSYGGPETADARDVVVRCLARMYGIGGET